MKIYITNDETEFSGYTPLSPLRGHNIRILTEDLVAASECTEILCPSIIDYIPTISLVDTIKNYVSKLRKNGKIIIGGCCLYVVTRMISKRELSPIESNLALYGTEAAHQKKAGLAGANDIAGILEETGLKVMKKSLNGYRYIVEAIRE